MANFDMAELALKSVCPNNAMKYDDKEMPSVMVFIPKFRLCDVLSTADTSVHPAFRVNGVEIDGFWVGKYQTSHYNGRAYSLPGENPANTAGLDTFVSYNRAKGGKFHEITCAEWAAIALWCHKAGKEPYGNKHRLKIHYYIRYMDDVIILGQDKETLHRWKAAVETFLREELALDLNSKTSIRPVRQGVEFVGVRIWPTHMKLRKSTVRRIKREVRKISALYAAGDMTRQDFYRRIASIRGLLKHTESASLRWRLNEIYRAELEKAKQKQLREEAQHEPFADHSGAGNGDGNAGTGYQDHGNPACRAG